MSPRAAGSKSRKPALIVLSLLFPALGIASLLGGTAASWIFVLAAAWSPSLLVMVGASKGDGTLSRSLILGLLILGTWLTVCLGAMVSLGGRGDEMPWIWGLPATMAIQIYGLLLIPLPFVVGLYAWTFQSDGIDDKDLKELSRRFSRVEEMPKDKVD